MSLMENRRKFFKSIILFGLAGLTGLRAEEATVQTPPVSGGPSDDRRYWVGVMERLANPVLENLARRELRKNVPVEAANPADCAQYTHLEVFGRLLAGIAPWLSAPRLAGTAGRALGFVDTNLCWQSSIYPPAASNCAALRCYRSDCRQKRSFLE